MQAVHPDDHLAIVDQPQKQEARQGKFLRAEAAGQTPTNPSLGEKFELNGQHHRALPEIVRQCLHQYQLPLRKQCQSGQFHQQSHLQRGSL